MWPVTGPTRIEREGISVEHPARFVLVGYGNPEEGELRPQLLDRFGLHVEVLTANDVDERVRIVMARDAFERDAESFRARFEAEQESLRRRLTRARNAFMIPVEAGASAPHRRLFARLKSAVT